VDESLRRALVDALGAAGVLRDGTVLVPGDAARVAAALRVAQEHRVALRIVSSEAGGETAPRGGAVLSLARLADLGVDAANGTARAGAGVTLDSLSRAMGSALTVPGFPPRPRSGHAGSLVARGEIPRRSICGVEAALPGGDLVTFGGGVLKDVVGYDLISALLGSEGRLAAVVAVWFRLTPTAARVPVAEAPGPHPARELASILDPEGILAGA
jgi:glycolate oxidase